MRERAIVTFFSSSDGWQRHTMEGALLYEKCSYDEHFTKVYISITLRENVMQKKY